MTQGPGEFLELIRGGTATTRGELLAETGLSRVTVAQRIDALVSAGIVRPAGNGGATGGRRATTFVFDPRSVVIVAALDIHSGQLAVVDAHGTVLAREPIDTQVQDGPEMTLRQVSVGMRTLLETAGIDIARVVALGLSVPGPIDPVVHRLVEPPIMPGWSGWPITETLREDIDVPVYIENDADAMAYGEWGLEPGSAHRPLVLAKASDFIGSGIVIDGHIYRGFDGGAGDIGHVLVGGEHLCRCGRSGCLAAEASGDAILRRLRAEGAAIDAVDELIGLVEAGDPGATAEVRRAGELMGRVLATVVGVLNPATLVIAGTLACAPLIAAIRSAVYAGSLPRATRQLDIRAGRLGSDSAVIGLARVALADVYSPESVNRRLGVET